MSAIEKSDLSTNSINVMNKGEGNQNGTLEPTLRIERTTGLVQATDRTAWTRLD